ncbi:glycerol-3-phosphate 1-O-acyltransferase PlsY [Acidithiobacillus ferrivorans]|jgi:glycerol-3-phosphate acyltransferase PlsY|uniref:Glycerol-3-phosphate acyltransferase n=1 Tax=Acidithiobacillus ferrivorans TaxID=160808 RepID=A0A1E7XVK8_9PROT|nr:glycerol-3-phosphate 1-O-acyltransferase PlsY [Acidithiobacillus ferrivorans]MBN6743035.1 glycerol-3-phosphate 1-O-acyltransferase PlsY [Acidithiobacillus sp. MC6.1]MBU2767026.1 glycerol-3-phosphate 1-O-acyltransferase PlsY [Acidithiobacillus ferrivorans]MBU2850294.1 glycerol-3-phosphate 1-O-acyltransferase PlsY [Acidithiobacillus ferrivorans]OFA17078.1 glycerol-3-phosphate acyltransferase [Acidithiobacillus ferrivorans]QQD72806.1 glycerol-3-phosphate 1-O-acyltransferase PlsY [Acidithiobaci
MSLLLDIVLTGGGYLVGSIATAILVARALGLGDPRLSGSGNPGATNLLRIGGKKAAALTLAGDLSKGAIPIVVARLLGLHDWALAAVALATFLGHLYPVFFGFRGGKGVATALGILLALKPALGGLILGVWMLVFALTRVSSLAALLAALSAVPFAFVLSSGTSLRALIIVLVLLVLWRHRSNIRRLLDSSESPFKKR